MTIDIIYYQFRVYVTIEHISSLDLGVYLAGQVMENEVLVCPLGRQSRRQLATQKVINTSLRPCIDCD